MQRRMRMSIEAHTVYVERRTLDRERTTVMHAARAGKRNGFESFGGTL